MSVVAAMVTEHGVWMACDTQITDLHAHTGYGKVERLECGALVGITGTPLWRSFVRTYHIALTDLASVRVFGLTWIRWAVGVGTAVEDGCPVGSLLVATPAGELFQVCSDGAIVEVADYTALGSGAGLALGALHAGGTLEGSILAAIRFDPFCGGEPLVFQCSNGSQQATSPDPSTWPVV